MTWLLALTLLAAPPCGDGVPPAEPRAGDPGPSSERPPYRIGPEDVLQISVWKNDSLSRTVPVRPDGMISLPLVNDVQASGLTPMELRASLVAKLSEFTPTPEVSVIVTDVRSLKVSVFGSVAKPGRYDTHAWITVLDALSMAGGLTEFARPAKIVVLRPEGRETRRIGFDASKVDGSGMAPANFYLQPGDIVVVP